MLDLSFRSVGGITLYTKNQERISIPSPYTPIAIDSVIGILKEICNNYDQDHSSNKDILHEFPPTDVEAFKSFSRREVWRMGSFIIFALNLKDILKKEYEALYDIAIELGVLGLSPKDALTTPRKDEIKKFKKYRDKIFAHTAFGRPKQDNQSMQLTSLLYFSGDLISTSKSGAGFGGVRVQLDKENISAFESIDHTVIVLEFEAHLKKWHEMYVDIVNKIKSISDSNFENRFGKINSIIRE